MNTDRRRAVAALTAAGLLWGTTVPLSKLALGWLAPGWLTFVRFGLAAAILLAVAPRARVRAACTPSVLASGAIGYGGSVVVQNAGITRTSVSHAALLVGATPVLVAIIAALWHRTVARPVAWVGFAVSLAGVGLVAGGGGGSATAAGDGLVLASLLLSAAFTVAQARRLQGRDPVALTAVQFLGAALAVLPFSVAAEGVPALPAGPGVVLAVAGLAAGGTLLPFTLFAYAQGRVSAEVAGAFLNLEPLVGAVAGVAVFGDPAGPVQLAGGAAILAGIALSSLPLLGTGRRGPAPESRARTPADRARARCPSGRSPGTRSPGTRSPGTRSPGPAAQAASIPQVADPAGPDPAGPDPAASEPAVPSSQPGPAVPDPLPGTRSAGTPRPRNPGHRRPPPRPGSARPAAYRAAARACRWAFTGRRGRHGWTAGPGPGAGRGTVSHLRRWAGGRYATAQPGSGGWSRGRPAS